MSELETVGIIGAGVKGRSIALESLLGDYRVILEDISLSRLAEATAYIAAALGAKAAQGKTDGRRSQAIAVNFCTAHSMYEVSRGADLLIEAGPEDSELQLEIFTIFDKFAKPQAVLASVAESISIADLAEMTNCPQRCVGLRFPDPLSSDRSLGITRTPKTSESSANACVNFARRLGFEPKFLVERTHPAVAVREPR